MAMQYEYIAIPESDVPRASRPVFQHLLDTYASETSKVITVWRQFQLEDMTFKPADRSSTVVEIMKHQLLSERRFFAEFIGLPGEPEPGALLPQELTPAAFCRRNEELCRPRLERLARGEESVVAGSGPIFRCSTTAHLGLLAARIAYRASPYAAERWPAAAG